MKCLSADTELEKRVECAYLDKLRDVRLARPRWSPHHHHDVVGAFPSSGVTEQLVDGDPWNLLLDNDGWWLVVDAAIDRVNLITSEGRVHVIKAQWSVVG